MLLFDFLAEPVPQGLRSRMAVGPELDVRLGPAVIVAAQGRHQTVLVGDAAVKIARPLIVVAAIRFEAVETYSNELLRQGTILFHIGSGMSQDGDAAMVVDDSDGTVEGHEGHGHESRPSLTADIPAEIDIRRIASGTSRPVRC